MMLKRQTKQTRRPISHRSSLRGIKQQKRAMNYRLDISKKRTLHLTFRRFHTKPNRRAQHIKVVRFGLFGIKEIAIYQQTWKRGRRQPAKQYLLSYGNGLALAGLVGVSFFAVQLFGPSVPKPPTVQAQAQPATVQPAVAPVETYLPFSKPSSVRIPSIGVDASMVELGLNADSTVQTPDVFSGKVGWYNKSPAPGQKGPSVLLGHVDTYLGPSVFWRLAEVTPGSDITVVREDGREVTYVVTSVQAFAQDQFPTQEVYGDIDHAGLRLITCGGSFNVLTQRYSDNTVVFARMR